MRDEVQGFGLTSHQSRQVNGWMADEVGKVAVARLFGGDDAYAVKLAKIAEQLGMIERRAASAFPSPRMRRYAAHLVETYRGQVIGTRPRAGKSSQSHLSDGALTDG